MKKLLLFIVFSFSLLLNHAWSQCPPPGFPPLPPGDDCPQSLVLCQDINGYCEVLDANNVQSNFPGCPSNVLNNDEWFSFVACASELSIEITPSNCQNVGGQPGMQGAMYEGTCNGAAVATQCGCTTAPFILTATTTPGQTYYIVLDGCAGDICDYSVAVLSGTTTPCPPPDAVPEGPTQVCPGAIVNYTIPVGNAENYTWTIDNPGLGMFTGLPTGSSVDVQWGPSTGLATICTQGINACGLSSNIACLQVNVEAIPPTDEAIDICIGQCEECAGQMFCAPGVFPVILQNYLGCDSLVNCTVTNIIVNSPPLFQEEFCGFVSYEVCGTFYSQTGIFTTICQNYLGCDSTVTVDLAIFEPEAIIEMPIPTLECGVADTVLLNGAASPIALAPGATTTYLWTGPGIIAPNNLPIVELDSVGEYCLTITHARNGLECESTTCVEVTVSAELPMEPMLDGNADPCTGVASIYTVAPNGSPTPDGFTWTTPNGEPFTMISSDTIEITWSNLTGGDLCVTADNDCGSSSPTCITITVTETPEDPDVSGPDEVCAVNQTETYTINNPQAGVTYNWTVPTGASFNGSGSTIDVNFDGSTPGSGQVCVTAMNDCGTSQPGCVDVTIGALPPTPDMTGPVSVCSNGTGYMYTVSNGQTGDIYNWTVPSGASIIGSGATIEVDFNGSSTGDVCVSITNECGTSMQTCLNVTVIEVPSAILSGSGDICAGSGETVDLTITLTGTGPWDLTYTLNTTDTINLTINSSPFILTVSEPGTYELITLSGNGGCDGSASGSSIVVENPLPTAELSGMDTICANSNEVGQLTIDLTGATPWTVTWEANSTSQAPLVITTTPFTLDVTESQAGTIILTGVTDANDCVGTVSGTGTVTVVDAPTVSNVQRTCDPTNTTYTVTISITGGDPSTYDVSPANGMLLGNTFTSNAIFSGVSYSFTVTDANDCNPVLVEGTFECNCETMAGEMDLIPINTCGNGPVSGIYDNTNEFLDGDDALVFMLHSGNGTSVIAPIVGEYATPDNIVFDPNTMTYGTTYYLSAVAGNASGNSVDLMDACLSVSLGTPITFFEIPTATLSGITSVCLGDDADLTVVFTGEAPWSIIYDDGVSLDTINGINANPFTLTVTPGSAGLNTYCLTAMTDNNCDGDVSGCGDVTVHTGVEVSDLAWNCNLTATAYVVTFTISGGDPSSYFVTGGTGTLVGGTFTSDEIPAGMGFSFTVDDANSCDPQTVSQTVVDCNCISDAGVMTSDTVSICGDGPITVPVADSTVLDANDVLLYYLHTGASSSLIGTIAINTIPEFTFDPNTMSYGTIYYVSSVVGDDDGNGGVNLMDQCLSIAPGTPIVFFEIPTAAITGGIEICPGETAQLIIDLTGDSPWTVTINGTVYDSIVGSPFILDVNPAITTVYQLTNVTDENCDDTVADEQTVTVHDPPTVALDSEDCNLTGTAYVVCFTISGGNPGGYQVTPNDGTLTGNQFCSTEIASGLGYSFSITDGFGCVEATISSPAVTCQCLTNAGDLDATPLSVCSDGMTPSTIPYDINGTEFLDPDDALCFVLYDGNTVLETNPDEPVFGFNPGNMVVGQVYTICPVAGNDDGSGCVDFGDPCFSIGGCVDVLFNELPTATLVGTVDICAGETGQLEINLTGTGPWQVTYQDAGGNIQTVTANVSPFTFDVNTPISTIITLTDVVDANGCSNTVIGNSATVNVHQPLQTSVDIPDCNALETEFTVTFTIIGGDAATYTVDPPGTIVGNVFTSLPMPSNSLYTFLVDDAFGCGPTVVEGGHACACLTQVGDMDPTQLDICVGNGASADYDDTNEVLDPDDAIIFILHSSIDPIIDPSEVIGVNIVPDFSFIPGVMQFETTYFITAVVGNSDGNGGVDPTDLCLSIAVPFTPVVFHDLPDVSVTGPAAICEGEDAEIVFEITGAAPVSINYLLNGQPAPSLDLPFIGTVPFPVPLPVTTTITLVSITDGNGCVNTLSESITVDVNPLVDAGTAGATLSFCQGDNQIVQLASLLVAADPGGTWTDQAGQPVPNGSVNIASLPVGTNTFIYTVSALAPCPDDQSQVEIIINQNPVADAGADQTLDCDNLAATLGGTNTTPGVIYTWSGPDISDPSIENPVVSIAGTYTLTVAATGGCINSDMVEVEQNITIPLPSIIATDVSCFGETDGFVVVENVENGVPPFLFSLNGGPFTTQQAYLDLPPGTHTLTVEDDAGCETSMDFIIDEPVEVTVDLSGAFNNIDDDPIIPLGESVNLTIQTTPGFNSLDTVVWSPSGADSLCLGCSTISVSPLQQTAYSVLVDVNGCTAEALLTVFISKDRPVFVPNAFSPNDDSINDHLTVFGGKSVAVVKSFLIFNRWGELMWEFYDFAPNDLSMGWDGKHRGQFLNPGVFTWFAEVEFTDSSVELYEGDVVLIR